MLSGTALDALATRLQSLLISFDLPSIEFGQPLVLQKAVVEAAKVFQDYAKAMPSKADAYAAALAFVRGQSLDERQFDLVAGALSERLRETGNGCALGSERIVPLLARYRKDVEAGQLWRLTWFGLLGSYFSFNPVKSTKAELRGWQELRGHLQKTWPHIDKQSESKAVPDWVSVMRGDPELVTERAAQRYALDYVQGDEVAVRKLSSDLAIPESSWFWHSLVLSAVERCTEQSDEVFKQAIPRLLTLLSERPVHRDEALEILLTRYHGCADTSVHAQLRDYVCRKEVWRNPKLRAAGLATAWNRVSDDVWRMVLQWVNKANLRDFFEVLAARRNADEGRLAFWSQYMEQIGWTRLIFSSQTRALAWNNAAIRDLIAREEDSYATISSSADVDAFMMQLGDYLIVEFSKVPNAAYVYKADELPFEPNDREYSATGEDLKYGFRNECAARLTHPHGWESNARYELKRLGIYPDQPSSREREASSTATGSNITRGTTSGSRQTETQSTMASGSELGRRSRGADGAPPGASFTMASLHQLISGHRGVVVDDRRDAAGGRLWVEDPVQRLGLAAALGSLGFKWANSRKAWYYPEN